MMAEKEVKIVTSEGTPITPEDAAKLARDPTAIFDDLDRLRVESKITVERRKVLSSCRCCKPDPNLYFRSCPDVNMRLTASLIRHKQERDLYFFVTPEMRSHPHVERALRFYTLVLIQTWPIGEYQLWPVPILGDKPMPSDKSQNTAFEYSLRFWTQMAWDAGFRDFNVEIAEKNKIEPVWPEEPFTAFLKLAFAGKVIDNDNHEYVRQLRGIAAS
jgi:hypothetical protein